MKTRVTFLSGVLLLLLSINVNASDKTDKEIFTQENIDIENKCEQGNCGIEDLKTYKKNKTSLDELTENFDFGIAIGFENYRDQYISEVETIGENRIVRISKSQKYKPSIWLETHYIWDGLASKWKLTHSAPGFYIGARLLGADASIFEAFSLGMMWSFKRTRIDDIPPAGQIMKSINIGFGPVWHKTKTLASGIEEGQPLPTNYTDVKLDERDEVSWILMISTGF